MRITDTVPPGWTRSVASRLLLAASLLALSASLTTADEPPPRPEQERLREHVSTLASPEFGGRRGEGARKAEAYLTDQFRALGLKPLFDGEYTQDITGKEPGQVVGRNVGARLEGADPALRDEYLILSAHYDHLGRRGPTLYPGADDNASGVAMMLEVARCLADASQPPRRSVLFVGFDLEEDGLWGSRHFVAEPPVPLTSVKLFMTADLIGGALGGVCQRDLFVMGSEHEPALRPAIRRAGEDLPLRIAMVGSDLLFFDRSDYGPFRARQVPYLFFSTGETPRYHTPRDTPDQIDYPKLEAVSQLIGNLVRQTANADALPGWTASPEPSLEEVAALRTITQTLYDARDRLELSPAGQRTLTSTIEGLDAIIARGAVTSRERAWMVRMVQWIMLTVL